MESLSDTLWDVVICGTGLKQSLLALSLSRSGKNVLHVDPNDFYGGPDAALSLQDAESWAAAHSSPEARSIFRQACISKPAAVPGLSARGYSLALAPQFIHTRSALVSQLVSSRAYRQIEFLAVGSFFVLEPALSSPPQERQPPTLARIPSTREDVFATSAIPARAKRTLMKFLKFVLDYAAPPHADLWQPAWADRSLAAFLHAEFKLDGALLAYVLALTLSLDDQITTRDGLAAIHRHLQSMGVFGPGFAAVYPKWGGLAEIAQVACRAGAVGGGVYMLGTDVKNLGQAGDGATEVELELTSGDKLKAKMVVRGEEAPSEGAAVTISRLLAIVFSPLASLFAAVVEGAPTPAVAVVALPAGSVQPEAGTASDRPIYAFVHSSDTGECPVGQSVLYLTTLATPDAKAMLEQALATFLAAVGEDQPPQCLYQLYYEQSRRPPEPSPRQPDSTAALILDLPAPSLSLAFDDETVEDVRQAWRRIMSDGGGDPLTEEAEAEFLVFPEREGAEDDEDDVYD